MGENGVFAQNEKPHGNVDFEATRVSEDEEVY
jgi:hypothetical protein